jgi:hypothetical protein
VAAGAQAAHAQTVWPAASAVESVDLSPGTLIVAATIDTSPRLPLATSRQAAVQPQLNLDSSKPATRGPIFATVLPRSPPHPAVATART